MTITVEFDSADLARLHRALDKLDAKHLVQPHMEAIGKDIYGVMQVYPPEGPWNRPPAPYYVRGVGTQTAEGYNRGGSQDMQHKWYAKVYPNYLVVGNKATYSGYIHGPEQVSWAPKHGWRKLLDVAKERLPAIVKKLEQQAKDLWDRTT
jgi:hypothetical protein